MEDPKFNLRHDKSEITIRHPSEPKGLEFRSEDKNVKFITCQWHLNL